MSSCFSYIPHLCTFCARDNVTCYSYGVRFEHPYEYISSGVSHCDTPVVALYLTTREKKEG